MKRSEYRPLMGKVVLVDAVYEREVISNQGGKKKIWERTVAEARPGWVVGVRYLQNGHTVNDYECGPTWDTAGVVPCLLVVYWPTLKPVRVPVDGCRIAPGTVQPYQSTGAVWSQECRDLLSNEMRDWPRDKRGRWVKK